MRILNNKILMFLILTFIIVQDLTLYATENDPDSKQGIKFSKPIEDILQKFKTSHYVPDISLNYINDYTLEELKQIDLAIMPNDDLFDSWISILIMTFPKDSGFDRSKRER